MRAAILAFVAVAVAVPASAQINPDLRLSQMEARQQAQDQLDRQRDVAGHNEAVTLDSQIRTERSLAGVRAQSNLPRPPDPSYTEGTPIPAPTAVPEGRTTVSIPDVLLQDSNARIRAAAANRR